MKGGDNVLSENEIKRMVNSEFKETEMGLVPPEYLIHNTDFYNYLIHRELKNEEANDYPPDDTFEYEGKMYLWCIVNARSESEAEQVIRGYWQAFRELNEWEKD